MDHSKKTFKKITSWTSLPALMLFVLFLIINAVMSGSMSSSFILSFISANAASICVAIGVGATIMIGGTDISLGSIVSLTNVILVELIRRDVSLVQAALIALLCAVLAGAINGLIIGVVRVNPLLLTFATSTVYAGIALWILPHPGGSIPYVFNDWFNYKIAGFFPMSLIVILIPLVLWLIISATPFGMKVYALGKDQRKAYDSGINVGKVKFLVHTFAGFAAGIGGLSISASLCAGNPTVGATMSMTSIAAAVIGGISLKGGIGDIWGAVFGAGFLSILISTVVAANLSSYAQGFVRGIILLLGVTLTILASDQEIKDSIKGIFKRRVSKG